MAKKRNTTGGQSLRQKHKSEYGALRNAIHRCTNPKHPQFDDYGGRGITVSSAFLGPQGFDNFIKTVGPKPSPELTLDRMDNAKGYEPNNLTWSTRKHQQFNRRTRKTHCKDLGWGVGEYKVQVAGPYKTHTRTVYSALVPLGDRIQTITAWSEELGIDTRTLLQRMKRGINPEEALVPVLFDTWGKPRNDTPTIH